MDIRIMISDAAGAAGNQVSVTNGDGGMQMPGPTSDGQANGTATAGMPGINAGPAPAALAFGGNRGPMTFISDSDGQAGQGHQAGQSAGAAPAM